MIDDVDRSGLRERQPLGKVTGYVRIVSGEELHTALHEGQFFSTEFYQVINDQLPGDVYHYMYERHISPNRLGWEKRRNDYEAVAFLEKPQVNLIGIHEAAYHDSYDQSYPAIYLSTYFIPSRIVRNITPIVVSTMEEYMRVNHKTELSHNDITQLARMPFMLGK